MEELLATLCLLQGERRKKQSGACRGACLLESSEQIGGRLENVQGRLWGNKRTWRGLEIYDRSEGSRGA